MKVTIPRTIFFGVLVSMSAALLFGGLLLHTEATIPTPSWGETVALDRLIYKARFEAKVSAVRLERKSDESVEPLRARWVFQGSNTDGQIHRLELQVRLLDEKGKQVAWFVDKHALAAGARDQEMAVEMKVKEEVWKRVRRVRIFADWIT